MLGHALAIAEEAVASNSPAEAIASFHAALVRHDVTYLQARLYRRPGPALTAERHWAAGGFVARYAKPGWIGSASSDYVCFENNPLLEPIRHSITRYRFSDYASRRDKRTGRYWDAMGEGGIAEALCAAAYGPNRRIASFHIGFGHCDIDPAFAAAAQTVASILAERLLTETIDDEVSAGLPVRLSNRERDAIAFVADGKTDWEIAKILGVSEATARFHVDNARKKLGAVNRVHAVARFIAPNGLF